VYIPVVKVTQRIKVQQINLLKKLFEKMAKNNVKENKL